MMIKLSVWPACAVACALLMSGVALGFLGRVPTHERLPMPEAAWKLRARPPIDLEFMFGKPEHPPIELDEHVRQAPTPRE